MRFGIASLVGYIGCLMLVACDTGGTNLAASGGTGTTATDVGGNSTTTSSNNGGSTTGGATSTNSSGGNGNTTTTTTANGGSTTTTTSVGPGTYALAAPNQCTNKFSIQDCRKGVTTSACGGVCTNDYGGGAQNACEGGKSGVPVNFACPRFLLYSDEFNQAAIDDGYGGIFNYGIVGHDVDTNGVDGSITGNACCQCYQIVFDYPKENQCWVNPDSNVNPKSAIPVPKPMIVQSFNTGTAGPGNFDIYMGAGGLGANNGCFSINGSSSPSGQYLYLGYPSAGQPSDGGVKPVGNWGNGTSCKNSYSWVTEATLGSQGCVDKVASACNEIKAVDAQQQAAAIRSCIQSNDVKGDYHLNWFFWGRRVECPEHLTQVTGCKPASQGLPTVDKAVTTVAQAQTAGFRQKDNTGQQYFTTTMEDCCMPTCAWSDNVKIATQNGYNTFYSCDQAGKPRTQ